MTKMCDVDQGAAGLLPPGSPDKSGVGVHYVDAFIKPMNATLEDGTRVTCKRKGLKVQLTVGDRKGEGLLKRIEAGGDPVVMLRAALRDAAGAAGVVVEITEREVLVSTGA